MGWSDYWNLAKGWFGYSPEQKVGKDLGGYLGQLGSEYIPIPGINGRQFGEWAGSFLPFKEGGRIGFHPQRDPPESFLPMTDSLGANLHWYPGGAGEIMSAYKQGGIVAGGPFGPSFSNIRQHMQSEGLLPMKKGGRVKKRKH
jgi:hypothetical protein